MQLYINATLQYSDGNYAHAYSSSGRQLQFHCNQEDKRRLKTLPDKLKFMC